MKPIRKYIFTPILLFLLTSALQAAPKAFDSLGNVLEDFQKDCELYQKDPQISKELQTACEKYNAKVDKAFMVGYPLDVSVENETASEKKLNHYLGLLRESDESRKSLVDLIRSETIRARESNNIKYFSLLIDNDKIKLSSENYEFMKQHYEIFQDHPKYKHAIWEKERTTKEKRDLEKKIAIAKKEAAKKKQRSRKNYTFSRATDYRPFASQGRGQSMSDRLLAEKNNRLRRHFERGNQEAKISRYRQQQENIRYNNQWRRNQMRSREYYRQFEP